MSIKLKMPNASWEGEVAGVKFFRGEGIFEDEALGRHIAESLGYAVEELGSDAAAEPKKPARTKKEAK